MKRNILFGLAAMFIANVALANRINNPDYNKPGRCAEEPMPPEECKEEQELAREFLTAEEYKTLVAKGLYSMHTRRGKLKGVCPCGCFEASTNILIQDESGEAVYKEVQNLKKSDLVVSMDAESTLSDMSFQGRDSYYVTRGPEKPALHVFYLENGKKLALTQNHAILLPTGVVVTAKDLKEGDSLLSKDGETVKIEKKTREFTSKDVYNFAIKGESELNHFVVAEGIVVGDILWQNSYADLLFKVALRK